MQVTKNKSWYSFVVSLRMSTLQHNIARLFSLSYHTSFMYVCTTCESASSVKLGKCPTCWWFGTFIKNPTIAPKSSRKKEWYAGTVLQQTSSVQGSSFFPIKDDELRRVFEAGVKLWWVYLLGGETRDWQINTHFTNHQSNTAELIKKYDWLLFWRRNARTYFWKISKGCSLP